MTQEQKDLLLKDLCSRLPYNVKVQIKNVCEPCTLEEIDLSWAEMSLAVRRENGDMNGYDFDLAKPYLFPLSSMTAEQKTSHNFLKHSAYANPVKLIDWYIKNHFDYRGLIPMGLANDATGKNIY